jgi:hypothetical protein
MRKYLPEIVAPLLGGALVLFALVSVGQATREGIADRVIIPFAAIRCEPPPGQERAEFLDEVQYLASFPDQLPLLEDRLAGRLAEAFRRHPQVEKVERVEILPTRQVVAKMSYRAPVSE